MTPIVTVPHPVLRQQAKPVTKVDTRLIKLIAEMKTALLAAKDPQGVGLAAPQVGVPLRLFLIRPDLRRKPSVFINPEILNYSQRLQSPHNKDGVYEGCLSIPHHYAPLKRSMSVTVKFQTLDKDNQLIDKEETFTGFAAHIIQHETDHLNGVLFIDHVLSQNSKLFRIHEDDWEEVTL